MKLADPIRIPNYSATLLVLFAMVSLGFAQNVAPTATAPANPLAFDVVSIRPSKPGTNNRSSWITTPDGYSVTGQPMLTTIMLAYFPQGWAYWSKDRLSGAPAWLSDQYDINAKVYEADLAEWQKQGLTLDQKPMLRQMLQAILADRCNLVAHMVPGPPIQGFSLELGKHAPRITESKPGETLPAGVPFPDGGILVPRQLGEPVRVRFYNATMADFAQNLSMLSAGHPVQDHTGLTGRYDFVLNWADDPDSKLPPGVVSTNDADPLSHWNTTALGFRIVPIKIPAETLVIDHIERPTQD